MMHDPNKPSSYPRRILLAVTGLAPQIVTETLYALAVTSDPPFVPSEVHLITTSEGAERARLGLLSAEPGWFQRLRKDYGLPRISFDPSSIHVLTNLTGAPLSDIRSPDENERAADVRADALMRKGLRRYSGAATLLRIQTRMAELRSDGAQAGTLRAVAALIEAGLASTDDRVRAAAVEASDAVLASEDA